MFALLRVEHDHVSDTDCLWAIKYAWLQLEGHLEKNRTMEVGASYMNYIVHTPYIVQFCSEVTAEILLAGGTTMASDIALLEIGPKG